MGRYRKATYNAGNGYAVSLKSLWLAVILVLPLLFVACGTKKNTAASRNWQAFNTRYNVYYNGKTSYDEQLQLQESKYEDDYTRTLLTHPA